jgi:hypothetical protein
MPDESQDVRCFQLTIYLSTDNPVVGATFFAAAGDNHDEVVQQPPRFQTSELQRAKTVCIQLLEKLARAAGTGAETINIHLADGGIILPDPEPAAPLPADRFYSVILTHNATLKVLDNDAVLLVELKLDRLIPNDSGSMVLFSPSKDGNKPVESPDPNDRFSFVAYVGTANDQPAETGFLRFKIKNEAVAGFIQRIRDKPNAHVFLAHSQRRPSARELDKTT